jgi:hypothetical protein
MSFTTEGEWVEDNSDYVVVRDWCVACEPDGVPEPWTPKPCGIHWPKHDGDADTQVRSGEFLSGSAEAGGAENRAFCELLRRNTR